MRNRRLVFCVIVGLATLLVGILAISGFVVRRWFGPPNLEATAAAAGRRATQEATNRQATKVALITLATDTALEALAKDIAATRVALNGETAVAVPTIPSNTDSEIGINAAPNVPLNDDQADSGVALNGLQIEITGINYDAWPLIQAQNQNNEPPLEGRTMLMITVRVTNLSGTDTDPILIRDADFQLIDRQNTLYQTFRLSCQVVPDGLDAVMLPGKSVDGNICFQAPADEELFELVYEPDNAPAVYFDLPGRSDTGWTPPGAPPVLMEAEELTRNGLQIDIFDIDYDAWPLVQAYNSFNDPPAGDISFLLITLRLTNVDGSEDELIQVSELHFKLVDSQGRVFETYEASCGLIPDELNGVLRQGDVMDGNLCFQISRNDQAVKLIYEPFGLPSVVINLPNMTPGK